MERVKKYFLSRSGAEIIERIHVFTESSATVELAAQRLGCKPAHIAKSLSFMVKVPKSKAENKKAQAQQQKQNDGSSSGTASPTSPTENAGDHPVVIVAAGDAKVNAKKYKVKYGCSPKMLKREEVEGVIGYPAGGVCPFGVNPDVRVYLDVSLKRFEKVYPACGTANTGVPLSCEELEKYADNFVEWVDVCDGWQEAAAAAEDQKVDNEDAKREEA